MKLVKTTILICLASLGVLVIIGLILPQQVQVERSITIETSQHKIFPLVNNLHRFNEWSPWQQKDPDTQYRFEGPESGVGAKMYWISNHPQVGSGHQKIIESQLNTRVRTHLDFGAQGEAYAYFNLTPGGDDTTVVWGFTSEFGMDLIGRYMGLMFDTWIGSDYEAGLENLKKLAEQD